MEKTIIEIQKGPSPKGHYSQMVKGGPFVFLSGQLPLTRGGEVVDGDIRVQAKHVLTNIRDMLEEAGSSLEKVLRMGVYLDDIADFGPMNAVYSEFFPKQPPARTTLVVSKFPPGIKLEIDVIALSSREGRENNGV